MKLVPAGLTQKFGRQILTIQKNSPNALFAAGIVGFVGTVVLASRATLKLGPVLDDIEREIEDVKYDLEGEPGYHKDLAYVYTKSAVRIGRLYAPTVVVGATSVGLLTGSHVQLTRRNTALTAAYATVATAYDNYRDRVRGELGVDKELDLYQGVSLEKVTVDGKTQKALSVDPNKWSPYARFFDESSWQFQKNAELNRLFVRAQQSYLNDILHARGHVFLNEAYDALGLERSKEGAVVGWILDQNGDNFIDFGIYTKENARFVNGDERAVLLDFNVDGVIFDKI
jgi:hypothetical protein